MPTKHTTLAEIARAVGLHVSTVSRVLNSSEEAALQAASPESVLRIRKAAEAMGYRPNQLARSLKSQHSRLAGVLMPGVTDHVLAQIYEAIEIEGSAHGYESIVANTHDKPELQERRSLMLLDRRVDGLILGDVPHHGGYAHALHERRVPFVLVSRQAGDFPCVVADDYGGGRAMAHHFADLGHREVAVLAGRPWASTGIERTRGFVEGMAERGIAVTADRVVATDFTNESGYQVSRDLLRRDPALTALFATNDFDALGVYGAAHELGRAPGVDLALGGFNNIAITAHLGVPMTTIDSPRQQMGQRAMRMLIDLIQGRSNGERLFLPTQLVVRATSCPPRN